MIGNTISHYKILKEIGSGGMGIIYKAEDTKLKRSVALKFLSPELTKDKEARDRFIKEAQSASALDHNNICTIHEINETEKGQLFIAMSSYDGLTLRERIEHNPLDETKAINITIQIAEGLSRAHDKGIVHRDIKPENIFIKKDGVVKILDFGLAKLASESRLSKFRSTPGTAAYMAPEQALGEAIDHRADIWSLGIVFYEMLTGGLPFNGDRDQEVLKSVLNDNPNLSTNNKVKISIRLQKIIQKALSKNPENRYQTVNEILSELNNYKQIIMERGKKRASYISVAVIFIIFLIIIAYNILDPFNKEFPPWLQQNAFTQPLITESGWDLGRISPTGDFVVYKKQGIRLRELKSGITKMLYTDTDSIESSFPVWSPNGDKIAFVRWAQKTSDIIMLNITGDILGSIPNTLLPHFLSWSPDGSKIIYMNSELKLIIRNIDGTIEHSFQINGKFSWAVFSPDSRKVVFLEGEMRKNGVLRMIDIETGSISDPLEGVVPNVGAAYHGGLVWSPDGGYLVYMGEDRGNLELFALPMSPRDYSVAGDPLQITYLGGDGEPAWPTFTGDGNRLSYTKNIDNVDIYVVSLDPQSATISDEMQAIVTDNEYEGEPCWWPDGKGIIYISNQGGYTDIWSYQFDKNRPNSRLTTTETLEKYPQFLPNSDTISFYADGAIWGIPSSGKNIKPAQLTPKSIELQDNPYAWSADRSCLFTTMVSDSNNWIYNLIKVDIEKENYQVLQYNLFDPDLSISPNDQFLAFTGFKHHMEGVLPKESLCILNIKDGDFRMLDEYQFQLPRDRIVWTKDSKFILNRSFTKMRSHPELIPIDGGPPIKIKLNDQFPILKVLYQHIDPSGMKVLVTKRSQNGDVFLVGN